LKTKLSHIDKKHLENLFAKLDERKFWTLDATIRDAETRGIAAKSVKEWVIEFAMKCNFYHLSQSLILDLGNAHWTEVFSEEELEELEGFGRPVLPPIDKAVEANLNNLRKVKTAQEAYEFARRMEYDVEVDGMLVWLSLTLQNTASLFFKENNYNIQQYLESEKLYYLWSFVNTILNDSEYIDALGKEKSSVANAEASNNKRKISAVNVVNSLKIGRRMDTVYVGAGDVELGCLKIGKTSDQTKEWSNGLIKMPIVMRDMLLKMVNRSPDLINKLHTMGYNINGTYSMLVGCAVPNWL
ncbi:hypothetical protein BDB00DRAFT_771698, partial [Zychaea mexicana]|uniref:uncharacterized protein n=1 Tax=Zychaea mexicana TaxID=64656 RepID=UPI0022FEB922